MIEKGAKSGRPFNPSKAGGNILNLSYQNVKITDKGVALVEARVRRFNPVGEAELRMVERLRGIATQTLVAEPVIYGFIFTSYASISGIKSLATQLDNPLTRIRLM